ncbi:MAG: hypothetical protein RLZZ318_551 [Bacteroidota bacterium]
MIAARLALSKHKSFAALIIRLAWVGVGLSVTVMIIAIAIVVGYKKQITEKVTGFNGEIEVHSTGTSGNFDYVPFDDKDSIQKALKQFAFVKQVGAVMSRPAILKTENELEGIVFKGIGAQYDTNYLSAHLVEGCLPKVYDSLHKRDIIVSKLIASKLQLHINDQVKIYFINQPLRVIPCKITGLYETGLEDNDQVFVIGSLKEMQRIFAKKQNQITHYEVHCKDLKQIPEYTKNLNQAIPQELYAESLMSLNPQIFQWLEYLDQNIIIILSLMAIVACINMITALLILIIERTNMIGILKALGSRNQVIKSIFFRHALYILGLGLLTGNLIGIGLAWLQKTFQIIKLDQATYYLSYVPIELNAWHILLVNFGTIIVCSIALLLPIQMVSKIEPVKAIQFQ